MLFSEHDILLQMAKQSAFGAVHVTPSGIVIPITKGSQGPNHTRNKIDNDARYADGFKRPFALGNHQAGAELPLVANLDFLGYPLAGLNGGFDADSGVVIDVDLTNGGAGYDPVTTVSFTGGGGTGAAATATVVGGVITKVTITNVGSGYTSAPTIAFTGGAGAGAAATAILGAKHSGKPKKTIIPWTIEEAIGAGLYYQYLDQVFFEMRIDFDIEGMFKPQFNTRGTGLFIPDAETSIDGTPTEIAGRPAEMLNWAATDDGGKVQKFSLTVTREVIEGRESGDDGVASEIVFGDTTVTGTVTALFRNDSRWAKAREGVLTNFLSDIIRGTRKFHFRIPELQAVPTSVKKATGQPLYCEFEVEGVFETESNSPIYFELTNGIATH